VAKTVAAKPSVSEVIMSIGAIIAIVIICVIVVAVAVAAGIQFAHAHALRRLFDQLDIRPLTPEQRARYEGELTTAQERFVENPALATQAVAALVIAVARDRGFSADDNAKLLTELSVGYSRELAGYRQALEATARISEATTEELREAVIGYRAMFRGLAGRPGGVSVPESTTTTSTTASTAAGTIDSQSTDSPVAVDARTKE
jgi:hypothetical protein